MWSEGATLWSSQGQQVPGDSMLEVQGIRFPATLLPRLLHFLPTPMLILILGTPHHFLVQGIHLMTSHLPGMGLYPRPTFT